MAAQEHLNNDQFPIEQLHGLHSSDFGVPMRSVRGAMMAEWKEHQAGLGGDPHSADITHGGPDKYIDHLAEDIRNRGVREPIQIRGNGTTVFQGHHRYLAAVQAGLTHVPVEFNR